MMMHKATLLMLCCLTVPTSCATLYPGLRFDQRALASFLLSSSAMLPNQLPHAEDKTKQAADHRATRHADAIFTNSYRKVLGQISARKFLQTVMGKRFGVAEARDNVKRQSGICKDTYKQDLTAILNEQKIRRWQQDVTRHSCSGSTCERSETAFSSPGGRRGGASDIDH
ncbi:somatoliberin [Paramormyrops kingsleyae]|uniref:Somatoliberin n=1 Tax=Paramormyrops kingsleyae TaxID=1676925 RepID=A0A3B3T5A2_9TELE|nr:somatoliberin isoform X3 [Paramormyrops kingsleyae]